MRAWDGRTHPGWPPTGPLGPVRAVARGLPLAVTVFGGLAVLLLIRLVERPAFGLRRPVTPHVTQFVCRAAFAILGMRRRVRGDVMRAEGACVANHASWLDIFALNASKRIYFVAKDEVAGWPGIGWLARATGTVFIRRDPREARAQRDVFEARLHAGHKLMFFPEGTSTDGVRILPFKPTLFAAFFTEGLRGSAHVQPVTLAYHAPVGAPSTFYGWWGTQGFAAHMWQMLATPRHGAVEVVYHAPLRVADHPDRKALARAAEAAVRDGLAVAGRLEVGAGDA